MFTQTSGVQLILVAKERRHWVCSSNVDLLWTRYHNGTQPIQSFWLVWSCFSIPGPQDTVTVGYWLPWLSPGRYQAHPDRCFICLNCLSITSAVNELSFSLQIFRFTLNKELLVLYSAELLILSFHITNVISFTMYEFASKWWQVILMCFELVLFANFHEMVLFCVTEAILQDCWFFFRPRYMGYNFAHL